MNFVSYFYSKGLRKALFMTLSSNAFEGSRPTYPPQSLTFTSANVAQLVAREAENPKVLGSILDFDRFLGSIPTFFQRKKRKSVARERFTEAQTHVPRFLILGWGGHESGFSEPRDQKLRKLILDLPAGEGEALAWEGGEIFQVFWECCCNTHNHETHGHTMMLP